jgi:diguanylate cyclase (GGDEF)-like protein
MPDPMDPEMQSGLADLSRRLNSAGLQIIERKRPWPDRMATYVVLGKSDRRTDIVIPDSFIEDLPRTAPHGVAVDSYAAAVAGRIKCGSPELFYCLSELAIRVEIIWPIQTALVGSSLRSWLHVDVAAQADGTLAKCAVDRDPFPFGSSETVFDQVRLVINRIRTAIDETMIGFYGAGTHPQTYQQIKRDSRETASRHSQTEIEQFLAGKVYILGFQAVDVPGEVWIADPWDAEYLGVAPKELSKSAYVLRARGLIQLDPTLNFARPTDAFLTTGWPAALSSIAASDELQKLSLSSLPKKEKLITDVRALLKRYAGVALLVIDLDHFKDVNDTKGHPEGDACLEHVVQVIGGIIGRKGTLYRWGGDEFAVSLPDFSIEEAHATAERIRHAVEQAKPGHDIAVTTSIGVSASDRMDSPPAEELLAAADQAMYESKRQGKNRVTSWPIEERLTEKGTG